MTKSSNFALKALLSKKLLISLSLLIVSSAHSLSSGTLDFAGVTFAESNNESGEFEGVLNLNYRLEKKLQNKKWQYHIEGQAFGASYPEFAAAVPEARIFYTTKETEISIGRKKIKQLNFLDKDWNLGVQTAFFRMDPFNPKEQGLLGFNYEIKTDQVFVDFFASPLFVPDQNPSVSVKDSGVVEANSPWSFLPPQNIELSTGGVLGVDYSVTDDSLPKLLNQHQFGGRFGIELKDLSILGMYYNRPSNQLGFDISAKVEAGETEGFVNVQAKPQFLREHFYGLQAESVWIDKLKIKNGFYGIVQNKSEASTAKFQTARFDYFFIATSLEYKAKDFKLSLKHLLTNKRQVEEEEVVYFETDRFLFENAVSIGVSDLTFKKVEFDFGSVYSYKQKVAQFHLRASKKLTKRLSVYTYFNMINDFGDGSVTSENTELTPLGMSRYAALDNVRLGVVYAL